MNQLFFAELSRRLREEGIVTGEGTDSRLPVLLDGRVALNITPASEIFLRPEVSGSQAASELYHRVSRSAVEVKEYITAMERSHPLRASGLDIAEQFRVLADFNGIVLAGKELEQGEGYQFVIWEWDFNRKGVHQGDYFTNDYEAAKARFAVRSGLIARECLFTAEQLTELYRSTEYFLEEGFEPGQEQMNALTSARKQIEEAVPDLQERLEQGQVQDPILNM